MKISELPEEVRLKALEYQRNESDPIYNKNTDYLSKAFRWENTEEGQDYWEEWNIKKINDPIVENVIDQFRKRSELGINKYGTTLEENKTDDFLQHLKEELMDGILYIEKLQSMRKL